MVQQMIHQAMAKARSGPRGEFARTLRAHLPGTATHVWVDVALLRDDELLVLAEER